MGPVAGEAPLEVAVDPLGELGGELRWRRSPASAAGRRPPRSPSSPSASASRVNGPASASTAARGRASARCRAGQLRVPGWRARRATRARNGSGRSARCAAPAPARSAARGARAGHSAATNWSRWARRSAGAPLISSSRSGRNTLTSGRLGRRAAARRDAPSTRIRFGCPGSNPTASSWAPSVALGADHDPRGLCAEAHQLALVASSGTSGPCSRSTAPRAGSSYRRRSAPR